MTRTGFEANLCIHKTHILSRIWHYLQPWETEQVQKPGLCLFYKGENRIGEIKVSYLHIWTLQVQISHFHNDLIRHEKWFLREAASDSSKVALVLSWVTCISLQGHLSCSRWAGEMSLDSWSPSCSFGLATNQCLLCRKTLETFAFPSPFIA